MSFFGGGGFGQNTNTGTGFGSSGFGTNTQTTGTGMFISLRCRRCCRPPSETSFPCFSTASYSTRSHGATES